MTSNLVKKLTIIGFIILSIVIISWTLPDFKTDPTPSQVRTGWYLPQQDIVWIKNESGTNSSDVEHLVLSGERDGTIPQFPDLSYNCRYENYTEESSGHKYMIAVWYFSEENTFQISRKKLRDFLTDSGKITDVSLNFTKFQTTDRSSSTGRDSPNGNFLPSILNTTGYESADISGLFFIVEIADAAIQPGTHNSENNEHYIVYYGTAEPAILSSRTDLLRDIIGHTYTYDRVIYTGAL